VAGRCSELSEAAGEPLAATAVTARAWLLVEVGGSWPRDVAVDGALPVDAGQAVTDWLAATPRSRVHFIRRPGRAGSRVVFVVRSEEARQDVRRFELERIEDLPALDLAEGGEPHDGSLVLICGHGSRDRCCALRGTAVFGALAERLGDEELWISSHQGGHRFAANVLVLPSGLQFGRVEPSEAPYLVGRAIAGRIAVDRYRGRTFYEPSVQAGEHAVRAAAGLDGAGELELASHGDGLVRFRAWDGTEWTVAVEEAEGPSVPPSCGDEPVPQRTFRSRIVARGI
jgi:hypothetical protein